MKAPTAHLRVIELFTWDLRVKKEIMVCIMPLNDIFLDNVEDHVLDTVVLDTERAFLLLLTGGNDFVALSCRRCLLRAIHRPFALFSRPYPVHGTGSSGLRP